MFFEMLRNAISDLSIASTLILGISNAKLAAMQPDPAPISITEEKLFFLKYQ